MLVNKRYLFFVQQPYSYGILRPLQKEIRQQGGEVAWFINGASVTADQLSDGECVIKTVADVKAFNPIAVFSPGNVVPDFFPGVKVQVFHGLEWKKKGHFVIRGFFDLYCTHGPITTSRFKSLAEKYNYFQVIETGWPKVDPCFPVPAKGEADCPVILFAPTFSPALTSAPALYDAWSALAAKGKYKVVVKFHPKMDKAVVDAYKAIESANLIVSAADSLIPLIHEAGVVVSDTSSAVTEALLMGKVVVTFNNAKPEPSLINFEHPEGLEAAIRSALVPNDALLTEISNYIEQVHPYQDGKSAMRVLKAVDQVIAEGVKCKPLNFFRRYKIRKALHYWRFR